LGVFDELLFRTLPAPERIDPDFAQPDRYSDEQLYALALYVYSLKLPPDPNQFDPLAAHGQRVFEREGCVMCHTPPLYTNNTLTLAEGFTPPSGADKKYDILPTGYKPYDVKTYVVKGHPFGLDLPEEDRKALILFLKTL
jgi:hypothetical protein